MCLYDVLEVMNVLKVIGVTKDYEILEGGSKWTQCMSAFVETRIQF